MDINEVLSKLEDATVCGDGWAARCPAHDDERPSLTVKEAEDGRILLYCHAECSYEAICQKLGLSNIDAIYNYKDESGELLYQVCRTQPKGFFQRRPNGKGGFTNGLTDVRRLLYCLPELLAADVARPVLIPEGEKDVDALRRVGLSATCNSGGAGKWRAEYSNFLRDRNVVVLPDNDPAGSSHAQEVAKSLLGTAASVKVIELPGLPPGGDVSDWMDAGGTVDQLAALADTAKPFVDSQWLTSMNRENRETGFGLTRLRNLLKEPEESSKYVWEDTLPTGGISICAAKPKVGKSTWARNLAVSVSRGEAFLGRGTTKGKVIYLALEEKRSEVADHFRRMGAEGEEIHLHTGAGPPDPLGALSAAIEEHKPDLVVIDPLSRFIRVAEFNSYGEITKVLEPLIDLARKSGCHILALHHNGKGEREGGDSVLGSTAFFAAVDTLIIMRKRDNHCCVRTQQRYGVDLEEVVANLDLQTGRITTGGRLQTIQIDAYKDKVLTAIGDEVLSETDIKERVKGNSTIAGNALRDLHKSGALLRTGAGIKGSPFLYCKHEPEESSILDSTLMANQGTINYLQSASHQ